MNEENKVLLCWGTISEECVCQGCVDLESENKILKERVAKLEAILMGTPDKKRS